MAQVRLVTGHDLIDDCFNRVFNCFVEVYQSFAILVTEHINYLGRQDI